MILLNGSHFRRIRRHYAVWVFACCLCALPFNCFVCPAFGGEIHNAVMNGDVSKVKALLKADPSLVSSKDEHGRTPLETLAYMVISKSDLVLDFGNSYGSTANATETKRVIMPFDSPEAMEIADLLIANGADINSGDEETPLLLATNKQNWKLAELLIKKGARVDAADSLTSYTALHYAAKYNNIAIAKMLIDRKAPVDAKDMLGFTPLHIAAVLGNKEVMELLIANKANVNAKALIGNGITPLAAAENSHHEDLAELLRQHGGHK